MALLFKAYQSILPTKAGKKLFYPRLVRVGNVTTDQIAKEIAAYSSLSSGDVKNTIDNLITVMGQHLQSSETVTLNGLGTFRMAINSNGRGVDTSEQVNASQASVTVRFSPSSTRNIDGTTATRSMVTGVKFVRFDVTETPKDPNPGGDNGGDGGVVDPSA